MSTLVRKDTAAVPGERAERLEDPAKIALLRRIKQSLAVLDRVPDCQTSTRPARSKLSTTASPIDGLDPAMDARST